MRKAFLAAIASALWSTQAMGAAGPPIDFTSLGSIATFNSAKHDTAILEGIAIDGFVVASGVWRQDRGYLWLRNDPDDHGLGYCSKGESCGATNTTGNGDRNELSNQNRTEIIRLTLPAGQLWAGLWVSSLDTGGTNGNETGTLYWSNSAMPALTGGATFSHSALGADEGSIFGLLPESFDVGARYLFFRAGSYAANGSPLNGTNNDYLVWGVAVTPVPEPSTYGMMIAGLGLLGFMARRRMRG